MNGHLWAAKGTGQLETFVLDVFAVPLSGLYVGTDFFKIRSDHKHADRTTFPSAYCEINAPQAHG